MSDNGSNQNITRLLGELSAGSAAVHADLLPLVYSQLRRIAAEKMKRESPGSTLQPTALVHEAWLRLSAGSQAWNDRSHFFATAAEAMRRILIDRARARLAVRRGAGAERVEVDTLEIAAPAEDEEVLAVSEALDAFAKHDAQKAELVKLRSFAGFTIEETAELLGISVATAKRHWSYARAWLYRAMQR